MLGPCALETIGQEIQSIMYISESRSVSKKLRAYPSPYPSLILTCYQVTVVGSREGQVRSCSDADIDPDSLIHPVHTTPPQKKKCSETSDDCKLKSTKSELLEEIVVP